MYKYENVKITDNNIHFENSCTLPKRDIKVFVDNLVSDYSENNVIKHRTKYSMLSEINLSQLCIIEESDKFLLELDNYIIIYDVLEIDGNNYKVWIHDVQHGDKEYIDNSYEATKNIYDEVFGK